jgi:4-diphosphocytidyl-2C-methyl-D-erythritol kinase
MPWLTNGVFKDFYNNHKIWYLYISKEISSSTSIIFSASKCPFWNHRKKHTNNRAIIFNRENRDKDTHSPPNVYFHPISRRAHVNNH